jgi:hypothetical protein
MVILISVPIVTTAKRILNPGSRDQSLKIGSHDRILEIESADRTLVGQ